tara:strand:- start:921 stop:1973 length:1053 start_codon:yes stop_codon:yes gene_type:complete
MTESIRNIITLVLIGLSFFLISKIQLLIIYLFIALVLSITINPLNNLICNTKIFKYKVNRNVAAILCLLMISGFGSLFGYILSPLIIEEIQIISSINIVEIQHFLNIATTQLNKQFSAFNIDVEANLMDLLNVLNVASITTLFQSMLGILGNIFMAFFSILFISFFLIRDRTLLKEKVINMIAYITPKSKYKINTIIYFIRRYFIGLCIQTTILFILFGVGMSLLGLPNPWILAVFAAVINIVPYFGPLIGFIFTSIMVGTIYLDQNMITLIVPLIIKSFCLFALVQSIDNFIIQPSIYSKAFNAHPLEIFFIALSAGFIGGLMWMVIAMPVYTIIRIIFSELLTNLKKA